MQYQYLDCDIQVGIAQISLLGSECHLQTELCEELLDLLLRLQEDRAVRVIVLADGDTSFDMSPDFQSLAQGRCDGEGFDSLTPDLDIARRIVTIIQEMPKPIVSATRGAVRESGLGLYLVTDLRVASSTATFTPPDMSRGLVPDWGLSFTLPRLLGPGRTLEFLWTRRTIGAEEADRLGLIDRLIPENNWEEELTVLLERISNLPQPAVRLTKLAAQQAGQFDLTAMLSYEYEAQYQCWQASETAEGMAAFLAGRSPHFALPIAEEEE